jgi:hypothetical protein
MHARLWRKKLGSVISCVDCANAGRVVVIEIARGKIKMLYFGVYMPYNDHSVVYTSRSLY